MEDLHARLGWTMADIAQKRRFNLLGYGAIALYVSLLGLLAAGVYGFNMTSVMLLLQTNEQKRELLRNGHMTIIGDDRTQCRSMHFDNQTSELTAEKVIDCDDAKAAEEHGGGGSYGMFRRSFTGQ
jgi:hypothetical protein